jgi:hypothetical protein
MRVFTVQGTGGTVVTEETALSAVDSVTGRAIPIIGNQYSATAPYLCCNDVTPRRISLNLVEVVCSYGYGQYFPPVAPLLEPEIVQWGYTTVTEEVDHDIDGVPIQNTAGSIMTGARQTYYLDTLTITKNVSAFDLSLSRQYRNTVNAASLTIYTANIGVVIPAGYMRCASIVPSRAYKIADAYVPVAASFEIADANMLPHPFQWRFINTGAEAYVREKHGENGWTGADDATPQLGRIVLADGNVSPGHPVRLAIGGRPYANTPYGVRRNIGLAVSRTFVNAPNSSQILSRMGIEPDTSSSDDCCYVLFRKCKSEDFLNLFSLLGIT